MLQGRPIFIQHLGAINYKKMSEITTEDRMIRFHVQEYERCARQIMPACSIVAGRHTDQTFAIIDVKGSAHSAAPLRQWLGLALKTTKEQARGTEGWSNCTVAV